MVQNLHIYNLIGQYTRIWDSTRPTLDQLHSSFSIPQWSYRRNVSVSLNIFFCHIHSFFIMSCNLWNYKALFQQSTTVHQSVVFQLSNCNSRANLASASTRQNLHFWRVLAEICETSRHSPNTFARLARFADIRQALCEDSPDSPTFAKGHFWEKCDSPLQIRMRNVWVSRIWRELPLLNFSAIIKSAN